MRSCEPEPHNTNPTRERGTDDGHPDDAIDIDKSEHDHTLHALPASNEQRLPGTDISIRLGFRLVKNLSRNGIERLLHERYQSGPYRNVEELIRRTRLNSRDQQALAACGALKSISGNRHRAHWDLLGVEQLPGMLNDASSADIPQQLPCLLYTSPSPRDATLSRMPSSA